MKFLLCFLAPISLLASYPYYTPAGYSNNGDTTFASSGGGSRIATATTPSGASEYEMRMTLNIKASGGTFAAYLRASTHRHGAYIPLPHGRGSARSTQTLAEPRP